MKLEYRTDDLKKKYIYLDFQSSCCWRGYFFTVLFFYFFVCGLLSDRERWEIFVIGARYRNVLFNARDTVPGLGLS